MSLLSVPFKTTPATTYGRATGPSTKENGMETSADDDLLLIPIEAARNRLGGISRTMVYELINRGEIIKVNIGKRGFITSESIAAYVDRLTQDAHV